jgi:hypothetical protein
LACWLLLLLLHRLQVLLLLPPLPLVAHFPLLPQALMRLPQRCRPILLCSRTDPCV